MDPTIFPSDITVPHEGQNIPIAQHPEILKTPDVPTLGKRFLEGLSELGKRQRLPTKESRPEEVKEFFSKLEIPPDESYLRRSRGVPETPDKYEWTPPEGAQINGEWLGKGKALAHELGLNNEQFGKLVGLHNELMQDAQKIFQTKEADGVAALKTEWGADYDKNFAIASRGVQAMFKDNPEALEKFNAFGLGNDPAVLKFMLEAGKLTGEDSSTSGGTPSNANDIQQQIDTYMVKGGANYERYMQGDVKALGEVEALYRKLHAGKPDIDLSGLGGLL
jgi:hypothetical protein